MSLIEGPKVRDHSIKISQLVQSAILERNVLDLYYIFKSKYKGSYSSKLFFNLYDEEQFSFEAEKDAEPWVEEQEREKWPIIIEVAIFSRILLTIFEDFREARVVARKGKQKI